MIKRAEVRIMRKLILIVVAMIFGLSVGLGSSRLLRRAITPVVPYCQVAKNDAKHSMSCYGPKFRIITSKIKLISPMRD